VRLAYLDEKDRASRSHRVDMTTIADTVLEAQFTLRLNVGSIILQYMYASF
jgi:hypothetical protein